MSIVNISNQTIAAGTYLTGAQTIAGDADLISSNIKKGVNIFGVDGSCESLNFEIIGDTTEPTNKTENMIWVNTDTAITSYIFSPIQPEAPSPGMLWIYVSSSSTAAFSAIEDNAIMMYPISANQYINDAWVNKTAKSWQGNVWVPWWDGYIYDTGNMFEEYTGGFASYHTSSTNYPNKGSFSAGDSYITVSVPDASGIVLKTKNKIDLTHVNTIEFSITVVTASSDISAYAPICFVDDEENHKPGTSGVTAIKKASLASGKSGVFNLDVSDLSGDYYIGVRQWNYAEGKTLKHRITKIVALV